MASVCFSPLIETAFDATTSRASRLDLHSFVSARISVRFLPVTSSLVEGIPSSSSCLKSSADKLESSHYGSLESQ